MGRRRPVLAIDEARVCGKISTWVMSVSLNFPGTDAMSPWIGVAPRNPLPEKEGEQGHIGQVWCLSTHHLSIINDIEASIIKNRHAALFHQVTTFESIAEESSQTLSLICT